MGLDLLCVGAANLDVVVSVDRAPRPDERVVAREIVHAGGGPAATAAVAAARLGVSVGFCGRVGADAEGDLILDSLTSEGVDIAHVTRDREVPSGASVIIVDRTEAGRQICARTAPPPERIPDVEGWLHVDQVGYEALTREHRRNSLISFDHGNPVPSLDLNGIDLYVPSRPMVSTLWPGDLGAAVQDMRSQGADRVVVTDGAAGAWHSVDGRLHQTPGHRVPGPLSTLGAGDVFHGALVAGVIQGRPLAEAVERANACAALACQGLDGRSAIPTGPQLDEFLGRLSDQTPTTTT
ncbi:carbohydrate kinase family protein [uncultured Serinicoccus sp.]|uniref:carbohydrate kinase family protein n=1 Tax=uncultured Serinicoccus sp. TaxID=735514 RepID=UPI002639788C|nr:carbohydrate kinase family protein [uncultured Serinicoccus sp.]